MILKNNKTAWTMKSDQSDTNNEYYLNKTIYIDFNAF